VSRSYEITILGNKFQVLTDLSEQEVREVEELVKKKLQEVKEKHNLIPPMHLLMLAMLNIAEECVRKNKNLIKVGEFLEKKSIYLEDVLSGKQ
jgi:cell division protein ZapA (FtsZ GTPase activity inhibitor)